MQLLFFIKMSLSLFVLLIQSVLDIRKREISIGVSLGGFLAGVICSGIEGRMGTDFFFAVLPGVVLLAISWITRGAIGGGDGLLLCAIGSLSSVSLIVLTCMCAFALAGITGLFLLVVFHKRGSYEMPFVPFLFVGWIIGNISMGGMI